jgi:hypothetical protein
MQCTYMKLELTHKILDFFQTGHLDFNTVINPIFLSTFSMFFSSLHVDNIFCDMFGFLFVCLLCIRHVI